MTELQSLSDCIVGDAEGEKTAIDEYSRFRYIEAFKEQSTYSSKVFLEHMLKTFFLLSSVFRLTMALSLPRSLVAARI